MNERTTITIRQDTYQRLCKQGTFQKSFDQVISQLLDQAEGKEQAIKQ